MDLLDGGAGDDRLNGMAGDDVLTGGAGADEFMFYRAPGLDGVTDFSLADGDRLRFAPGFEFRYRLDEDAAVFELGGGHEVRLIGVEAEAFAEIIDYGVGAPLP